MKTILGGAEGGVEDAIRKARSRKEGLLASGAKRRGGKKKEPKREKARPKPWESKGRGLGNNGPNRTY